MNTLHTIRLQNIRLTDGFWKSRTDMVAERVIPYQWETLNNRTPGAPLSYAVENFRIAAGESLGEPRGTIFQDSDVAKWIEAASYSLITKANPELEAIIDELIRLIAKSQQPDGYVNTFFIVRHPEKRWKDLTMGHEMYCAGHMIEAAVAYYLVTGKRMFLDVMQRYADYIGEVFGPGENQNHSYDGHPEIELALYRLAEVTEKWQYADLADHFVNIRGSVKDFHIGIAARDGMIPKSRWFLTDYYSAHKPVREMDTADGHVVRALYLYSAMADQFRRTGDQSLLSALKALWRSAVSKRMYITAGMGSQAHGERFTVDYDLPSDTAFTETCAAVALVFWAWRMSLVDQDAEYADVIERAIYNGALGGVSLDGTRYFYVNPLEVVPQVARYRQDHEHVLLKRTPWHDCACCPTNIARLIASIGSYAVSISPDAVTIHQYMASVINLTQGGVPLEIVQETEYPWDGKVRFTVQAKAPKQYALVLRIPGWCANYTVQVNGESWNSSNPEKGYLRIDRQWTDADTVELCLEMPALFIRANSRVWSAAGKVALQRGPLVYCVEEIDNGTDLHELLVDPATSVRLELDDTLGVGAVALSFDGYRDRPGKYDKKLYFPYNEDITPTPFTVKAVPYYLWGNRAPDREMRIWLRVKR